MVKTKTALSSSTEVVLKLLSGDLGQNFFHNNTKILFSVLL